MASVQSDMFIGSEARMWMRLIMFIAKPYRRTYGDAVFADLYTYISAEREEE
jgi:hypothetical protein